ncbi:CLUMA_CG005536, isoform A [Clunio marinus]|uniref:CLUMA_CG005536, isoform A n=1 Tax=Clunio marinus TaxID=568069 RepID=A0A1J1HV70_9DIPT|nr:CLUMA_CG005536, isoform A [Clunio marinus]
MVKKRGKQRKTKRAGPKSVTEVKSGNDDDSSDAASENKNIENNSTETNKESEALESNKSKAENAKKIDNQDNPDLDEMSKEDFVGTDKEEERRKSSSELDEPARECSVTSDKEEEAGTSTVSNDIIQNAVNDEETSTTKDKDEEGIKPVPVLRLVPLTKLLKPDFLAEPVKPKANSSKNSARKSSGKSKKSSYIEISSTSSDSEIEQISITSSDSSDVQEVNKRKKRSSKETNSTNKKLTNGNSINKISFKEPESPTIIIRNSEKISVNLEKMPCNVNKLMKTYRIEETWSESDDFESMISMSKIDRKAVEKSKEDDEAASKAAIEEQAKRPEKTSAKYSKLKRKNLNLSDITSDENDSDDDEKRKKVPMRMTRSLRQKFIAVETESEIELPSKKSPKKKHSNEEFDLSSSDEKILSKRKKSSNKDDHSKEKVTDRRRRKSTSSESDRKEVRTRNRLAKSKEPPQMSAGQRQTRSRREVQKNHEKNSMKSNDLRLKEMFRHSSAEKSNHDSSDGNSESSSSSYHRKRLLTPLKCSKSEVEHSQSDKESDTSRTVLEDEPPVLEQKFRSRNKFEKISAFDTLKKKIEQRKKKQKVSDNGEDSGRKSFNNKRSAAGASSSVKKESEDDEMKMDETTESPLTKKLTTKRKRLISSSEDENNKSEKEINEKKKKKMSSSEEDFNPQSSEEENNKSNSSDDDDDKSIKSQKKSSSDEDSDDDIKDLENDRPKKRRKRIKKVASSDDEDGEGGEKNKSGRKNIRKMLRTDKLDVSTKEAAKLEKERKQRIEDRQKLYNQFYDERPEEAKEITKLVLDFDEASKKTLLEVDKKLVRKLKPHQANGIKFMWDACYESLERCRNDLGSGCILAHCMGLGKTLQVITLVHTLLKSYKKTDVFRVLVVCPLSTVLNWVNEFNIWLKDIPGSEDIYIYEINKLKQNIHRANKLMEWHNDGGVMILSYDMFRNLTNDTGNRFRKKIKESLQTSLVDPGPDLVICDEGHLLKNEKTSISKAMMRLRTLRRIVLTGTPLQNNLKEYYCMVQFVKPNLLGKYQEYMNRFVNPITNGQYTDSTDYDIAVMRRRAHVLHKMLDGCVQRRDYSVLAPFLPPKHEYVLSVKLTPMQIKLYKFYMQNKARSEDENGGRKGSILFKDFQNLQRIWTAPLVLRYNSNRYEHEMQRRKMLASDDESEGSLKDFIDDSASASSTSSSSSNASSDDDNASIRSDEPPKKKKKKEKVIVPRRTRAMAAEIPSDHEKEEEEEAPKNENPTEWWMQICPEEEVNNLEHSSKLMLLMSILEECEAIGDKLLVFSQSIFSLDVIEHFLNQIDEKTQMNASCASFTGSWSLGQDYFRLDGSTPVEQRNIFCKNFNSPSNPRARLFLISTRAGGLGINLVAANRVIIFDVSWNPSHDIQSIFRVYRFGQNKPCYIYRFLALGTMEEKIYERQVTKQAISKRVIDEQQIDRHYNQNDLQELYKYDLEPDDERILPILPKDRLFAEMLKKYDDVIYKYHEHDTLLENKEEETLNEEERRQAWEEFESERKRPQFIPQPYIPQPTRGIGPVTSNNIFGIRTDVLLKLLSMKARLDNPMITDGSVKQAIPLLMQELYRQMERGELTLYQQLIALSSSLEVPTNYGGQFHVDENMMQQTYNSMNSMPSTSSLHSGMLYQQQQEQLMRLAKHRQQQMLMQQLQNRSPPRVVGNIIEID